MRFLMTLLGAFVTVFVAKDNVLGQIVTHVNVLQETRLVSVDSSGVQGNKESSYPSISASGYSVAFSSEASNLVEGDLYGYRDAFVHNTVTGVTERVSVDSSGTQGYGHSFKPSISGDGRFVVFLSGASNLVANDTNDLTDVFVHDRLTGITERVSISSSGMQGDSNCWDSAISVDGLFVVFSSAATNLVPGDTNGMDDVFLHDRQTGQTMRVSVDSRGVQGNSHSGKPSISGDGHFVVFESTARNLVEGGTDGNSNIFVRDLLLGITELVSINSSGEQGNGASYRPSISINGQFVAFESIASNLVVNDTNGYTDIFVHDRLTGVTRRVSLDSLGGEGNEDSFSCSISANGYSVAFESEASNFVANDTNGYRDAFVHNTVTGVTERVSVDSSGVEGNAHSGRPFISYNGENVTFESSAWNLVANDTNGYRDVFVHGR